MARKEIGTMSEGEGGERALAGWDDRGDENGGVSGVCPDACWKLDCDRSLAGLSGLAAGKGES